MNDTPGPEAFAALGLPAEILTALRDVGYETPSSIQAATIPPLLAGSDVLGLAQTGTGKTAAFALPLLARIDISDARPQVLVLAPTRELALQVSEAFERYASHLRDDRGNGLHVLPVYGGQGYGVQLSALRRGVHVVVGTPGRVIDHLDKGTLDLSHLKAVVLDEADEMLTMGFSEDVDTILSAAPSERQVALFSATMPRAIRRLADEQMRDPVEITVESKSRTASTVRQRALVVSHQRKLDALTRILEVEPFDAVIIFARTKQGTEELAEKLRARGVAAAAINGDVPQVQRERTVQQLRDGTLDILVATDVAARGLDVERITHVINHDLPTEAESYVHRIGRTGRAGRSGDAISLATPREKSLLRHIEKSTGSQIEEMRTPTTADINSARLSKFDDGITDALADGDKVAAFRDIVDHYVRHHDVPELDVAAALAIVVHGDGPMLLDESDPGATFDARDSTRSWAQERDKDREQRPPRPERGPSAGFTVYRIGIGSRDYLKPGQVVGAIAGEANLTGSDFGAIRIRPQHTLVELADNVPADAIAALRGITIAGKRVDVVLDDGSTPDDREFRPRRPREGGDRGDRGGRPQRYERNERNDRSERGERRDRPERGERRDRPERGDRPERRDRPERNDRPDRGDRSERAYRSERRDYGHNAGRTDRPQRSGKPNESDARGAAPSGSDPKKKGYPKKFRDHDAGDSGPEGRKPRHKKKP